MNNFPYKKAIVTGGAGFIGSHLVEKLLKMGLEVISIDNYSAGKRENLAHLRGYPKFFEVAADVTQYSGLKPYFKDVDVIFHQAASKKTVCLRDPRKDLEVNGKGTYNILQLAREFNVKKVVHASTGSVYGEAVSYPQNELHPLNPTSYYGVSKLAGERYAIVFHKLYGLNVTVLRYFHVYGPRQEFSDVGGVIPIFGRRIIQNQSPVIFGDGNQQRSFTYVKDVVAANILVAADPRTVGEVYNCASGIKVTIKELTEKMLEAFGKKHLGIKYEDWTPGDIKIFDIDNSKLKKLGFEFGTKFEDGLLETINWLKEEIK
jgi:UDP-glucose 4-epimerase